MKLRDWKDMYDYIEHIVQFIKNDGTVVTGYVSDVEVDFDKFSEKGFDVDTDCLSLPHPYKKTWYPTIVKLKDIKDIEIIE